MTTAKNPATNKMMTIVSFNDRWFFLLFPFLTVASTNVGVEVKDWLNGVDVVGWVVRTKDEWVNGWFVGTDLGLEVKYFAMYQNELIMMYDRL